MSSVPTAIHWFRRDLRLSDNTALHRAVSEAETVVPVYIASAWRGRHGWTGPARQEFLCGCLRSLEANVAAVGGALVFRQGDTVAELERLLEETGAGAVYTNRDPDPHGGKVEGLVAAMCRARGVSFHVCKDAALHERDEVMTGSGGSFRVFTPYNRAWLKQPKVPVLPAVKRLGAVPGLKSLPCPTLETWGLAAAGVRLPEAGERAARERLRRAVMEVLPHYSERRDTPDGQTTSRLSQDLRFGTVSIREIYHRAVGSCEGAEAGHRESVQKWVAELAWREFYMQVLWHFPEVLEHEFDAKFRGLPWEWDEGKFARWKEGTTGFPIVDAGMRELSATGFMHNRVRMITAMFLTKDLHLDWRMGERYFMQVLADGEIASNNGGWQWSAGTGADAAPYFRIQNPWTQAKRFDPEGRYIRRWVPELRDAPSASLFAPPEASGLFGSRYPRPMVDHAVERDRTLAIFQRHKEETGRVL